MRSLAVKKEGLTRFVKPDSPSYNDGNSDRLFPFSYSNQVLDISYDGNNFKSIMVDSINESPDAAGETLTIISILGGPYLATSLGENFKAYIRSWRSGSIDAGSPIEVYVAPQLLRVQEVDLSHVNATGGDTVLININPPTGDNYVAGSVANKYHTTYVFKTPLTFSIVEGGVKKYITFKTALDQD
jgi:hypothetical protein